jgi:hypothetical protein
LTLYEIITYCRLIRGESNGNDNITLIEIGCYKFKVV